jgi:uncharacterized protein
MKKTIIMIYLCSVSIMTFSQGNKNIDISKQVINNFQNNEFSKIEALFDQTMKNALPAEKLKIVWNDLNEKCGKFQKISTITVDKIQNYDVTFILCHFEKMNLEMKTVFDEKNQIAGLFFIPEDKK